MPTSDPCEGTEQPDFSSVPVYHEFVEDHDSFFRIHIHLIGVTGSSDNAIGLRKGALIDAIADPYVVVTTFGDDTGSTDYFPIGTHTFSTLQDCRSPVWDQKCLLLAKKESTSGIRFRLMDENKGALRNEDTELFAFSLERDELPPVTTLEDCVWTDYAKQGDTDRTKSMSFKFRVMVTDGSDRIVSKEETLTLYEGAEGGYIYEEHVLPDGDPDDIEENALLQCWKCEESTKAVLWVLGRNDCFMHPHVATKLFFANGYDLYVVNYKQNGHCRKHGFVKDAHWNSHNKHGDFDRYHTEISLSLDKIASKGYETLIGYAHSTGGLILLNYLMDHGDTLFDAFIFNSPFLDWGYVGGDMVEFALKNYHKAQNLLGLSNNKKFDASVTPEGIEPIEYLGQEIVLSAWSARLWSLHYFDWSTRPLYKVPMTAGFAVGVAGVQEKWKSFHDDRKQAVITKPFLCITSRGDDVLKHKETLNRADWIGKARCEIELNDNGHDVFLSNDPTDEEMAVDMVLSWMKNRRLS